jgi:Ca2+-transporting ATPase
MKRAPRSSTAGIFADGMGFDVVYQGVLVAVLTLISYLIGSNWQLLDSSHGTTMAFLTMSLAEIFHSLNMRSQRGSLFTMKKQNVTLWLAALGSFAATIAVCAVPFLAGAFGFETIGLQELGIAAAIGVCIIPIVEIVKLIQRKIAKKGAKN